MFFIIPKEEDKFERAYLVRKKLSVSVSVSSLMNFFQTVIKPNTKPLKHLVSINMSVFNLDPGLQQAFINKTRSQKIDFYCNCVQFLQKLIRNPEDRTLQRSFSNPVVLVSAFLRSRVLGRWDKVSLRINRQTRKLVIVHNKSESIITIDNYYSRRSKDSSRKGIVLEPITHNAETGVLRLAFEEAKFEEIAAVVEGMVWDAAKFRFLKELQDGIGDMIDVSLNNFGSLKHIENFGSQTKVNGESIMGWTSYINSQILSEFKEYEDNYFASERYSLGDLVFRGSSKRIHFNIDTYVLTELYALSQTQLMTALKIPNDKWNKFIKQSVLIEKPQYQQLEVVYERCRFKEKAYDFMYLREDRSTLESAQLFVKPVTLKSQVDKLGGAYFQHMFIKVQPITEEESRLVLEIKITKESTKDFIIAYLGEFSNIQQAFDKELKEHNHPREKWKIRSSKKQVSELSIEQQQKTQSSKIVSNPTQGPNQNIISQNIFAENTIIVNAAPTRPYQQCSVDDFDTFHKPMANYQEQVSFSEDSYIKVKHSMKPNPPGLAKDVLKVHYLFQDWDKAKQGGVICKNEAMINEQKKVFGYVIKSLGKNLFKSRNILNISLPVGIFKKESHLESIARNLSFAPILLQKACSSIPLQRMKWMMIYLVTVGVIGISMQKPFNPLLGETFQGWIDGCPVWIQQISHHPPISAYFMQGRGYRTHGKIQPKIELGMNSVKGVSEHQNTIEFENGDIIKLTFMKMVIHGLLFGDREFNFEHRNYVYDSQNALFAEVYFGPKKKSSYFGKSQQPQDYLYGRIVRLTPSFNSQMRVQGKKTWPEKEHIAEQLSKFQGVWTEQISFDGVRYLDFKNDLPCAVVDEPYPLKSNPNYRKDIQKLKQGSLQQAQQQKERIEEVQRRDRRLRQAHAKNKH